nr:HEAT repeat-containing protein 4 isoform X1 [Misgurnus anguillicaudatus]XP_055027725.1 HEAT repeat-containing protein 4 isoform X1 [Misgurnus anguillicaudatus]XP_055027726.1 HEAT repeat-containing protein 4 isoform X1 [Misgurnus anguillicaudatus]
MDLQHAICRPENHSKFREKRLYKRFLNNASQGLSFSEEVVCEMGPISYRKHADFSWLFHPVGPLASGTTLKKIRKNRHNVHWNINSLTQEAGSASVQALTMNTKASFKMYSDQSKYCNAVGRTGQINVHTSLQESFTEDWESQNRNSKWQEFVQKKLGKTTEKCFNKQITREKCENKSGALLPLRKQHRVLDYVSSPGVNVQNCLNKTASAAGVKSIEIPQSLHLQDIQDLDDGSHVYHTNNIFKQGIFTGKDSTVKEVNLAKCPSQESTRHLHCKPVAELSSLRYALNNWRFKLPWQKVTLEGLKRALIDPNYLMRLEALITCASGAVNGLQQNLDPGKGAQCEGLKVQTVPQELQDLIVSALNDPVRRVQMAAAVCQYVMRTPNSRAKDILKCTLKQDLTGTGADSWMAAQCLAIDGDTSQSVIQRLLSQHFLCDSPSDQKQSLVLLSSISRKTTLVRSLLAEELSNANWRIRFQACNSIALLRGPINKDLCNKLIHMMWNDWSCDVRKAAAQALSKLDRDLHIELSVKLKGGPTAKRLEALMFIGQLNIMTPKLLPTFLQCFNDDFVAVRKQACLTAASLIIKDQTVLDQLINLMQNDPLWEVKVEAINALGRIGCITPGLQELLMWALHLEEEPSVRIAACEALSSLEAKGPELQRFLQERYALESNIEVQRHIEGLLEKFGYSLEGDESTIQEIKQQVELLCSKHTISMKVLVVEEMEKQRQQISLC